MRRMFHRAVVSLLVPAALVAGGIIGAGPTLAAAPCITVWELPYPTSFPAGLTVDDQGLVYVAASGDRVVYRLDPTADVWRSWGVGEGPEAVLVANGTVFTSVRHENLLVYLDPNGLAVSSYRLPWADLGPGEIHRGPDTPSGKWVLWVACRDRPSLLRYEYDPALDAPSPVGAPTDSGADRGSMPVTPRALTTSYESYPYDVSQIPHPEPLPPARTSSPFTEWTLPQGDVHVEDIATTTDGAVWISFGTPFLYRLDPTARTLQLMETIRNVVIWQGLTAAADGSAWFGNVVEGGIGHFDPVLGISETWRIPGAIEIFDLAFDALGRVWFTDRLGDAVGRLDPATGEAIVYPLPENSEPLYVTVDAAGDVWFTAGTGNFVARLTVDE